MMGNWFPHTEKMIDNDDEMMESTHIDCYGENDKMRT